MEWVEKTIKGMLSLKEGRDMFVDVAFAQMNVVDKDNDVALPGFFGSQMVRMVPGHDWTHVPLGKGPSREEGDWAIAGVQMNKEIQSAREWYSSFKQDIEIQPAVQEFSYGFFILPGGQKEGELGGKNVRFLTPIEDGSPGATIPEVSPVMVGAGVDTHLRAVKGSTFLGEVEDVLAAFKRLTKRTQSLADMRAKQDRRLSVVNEQKLMEMIAAVKLSIPEIEDLLKSDDTDLWAEARRIYLSRVKAGR